MSTETNYILFVDNTLLKMSLSVVRSAIFFVTSPGKLITSPPTVSQLLCVSAFCGRILTTIIPYVTVHPADTFPLWIKNMVFVPDGILVMTPLLVSRFHLQMNFPKWI